MNEYERRQEERRERLEAAADRAEARSRAAGARARGAIAGIPPGQPILVGHHSERRHRADLRRHDNAMRKAIEEDDRAAELRSRAAGVGRAGISSDDPDAVPKLREKLEKMEAKRERMKRINAAWRKAGKPEADNAEAWAKAGALAELDAAEVNALRLGMANDYLTRAPFTYELTNLGGNIKRVKERIASLERATEEPEREPIEGPGFRVYEDREENRTCVAFDAKPAADTRAFLKARGFRWNRRLGAWTRHLSTGAWYAAEVLAKLLTEEKGDE